MLKSKIFHLFLVAMFCFAVQNVAKGVSVAGDKIKKKGEVVSCNKDTGELVYKQEGADKPVTIMFADKKVISKVEPGMNITAVYTEDGGVNKGERIVILKEKRKPPTCGGK